MTISNQPPVQTENDSLRLSESAEQRRDAGCSHVAQLPLLQQQKSRKPDHCSMQDVCPLLLSTVKGPCTCTASTRGMHCPPTPTGSWQSSQHATHPRRRADLWFLAATPSHCCLQEFPGAERIVSDVQTAGVTVRELQERRIVQDDRIEFTITDSAVLFGSPDRGSGY